MTNSTCKGKKDGEKGRHTDAGVAREAMQLLLVLVSELEGCEAVLLLVDVVGVNHCCEHGEAVLDVQAHIKAVGVHACMHNPMPF